MMESLQFFIERNGFTVEEVSSRTVQRLLLSRGMEETADTTKPSSLRSFCNPTQTAIGSVNEFRERNVVNVAKI